MNTHNIQLFMARLDGGTQSRASLSESTIDEYAEAIANGATFPPVTIFHDGDSYWLAEGFHRFRAHEKAARDRIACDIRQGTRREAVLFSVGANAEHGLRRTNADKRRAVMTLLNDDEWSGWSDRDIARQCGVSHTFVSSLRLPASGNGCQIERRVERGGSVYTMSTSAIGRASPAPAPTVAVLEQRCSEEPPEFPPPPAPDDYGHWQPEGARRAYQTASVAREGQKAAVETGLDAHRSVLLEAAKERTPAPEAPPRWVSNLDNLEEGKLARWIIASQLVLPHMARMLRATADLLEMASKG